MSPLYGIGGNLQDWPGTLDAAWRDAEEALPEGWRLVSLTMPVDYGDRQEWVAAADYMPPELSDDEPDDIEASGATPAEALRNLAVQLRQPEGVPA